MQFSKTTVIDGIKANLLSAERSKQAQIELALSLCLDDLATSLHSDSMLSLHTQTVAASSRTVEVRGPFDDLRYILALKWSTGLNQKNLEFIDKEEFLKRYDNPGVSADIPNFWTQLTSSEGFPVVKFNVPTSKADTLSTYYYTDLTQDNLSSARSAAAIVTGATAWFYGIADGGKGQNYYERFKEQLKNMRAGDDFRAKSFIKIAMSKNDTDIRDIQNNVRIRRA